MDILIVGGTRFVGYGLVWRLLARGDRVTILNRGNHADPFEDRVERLIADRTTPEFARVLAGRRFDGAVDFAAFNGRDAEGVIGALDDRVGHYIFISSGQTYLVTEEYDPPSREDAYAGTLLPRPGAEYDAGQWDYGAGKREAEDVFEKAWRGRQFPATRLRLPMINGERDASGRINAYLWRLLDGGPLVLPDGGENIARHVYSGDVVTVISSILGNASTFGRAYNLAQEEMSSLRHLVGMLANELGAPAHFVDVPSASIRSAGLDVRQVSPFSTMWMSCIDPSLAKTEIGFSPTPLHVYLARIVAAFLAHPPAAKPEGYEQRPREIELAEAAI